MPEVKKENRPRAVHLGRDSVIAKLDADGNLIKPAETKGPIVDPETGAHKPATYPVKAKSSWETGKPVPVTLTRVDS
jgi:hypothetical protein